MSERAPNDDVVSALRQIFPEMTETEGKILWGNVINKDVYMPDGRDAGGTFRTWGKRISLLTGVGDYLTYYMSYSFVKMLAKATESMDVIDRGEQRILKTLSDAGWRIEEMAHLQSSTPTARNQE